MKEKPIMLQMMEEWNNLHPEDSAEINILVDTMYRNDNLRQAYYELKNEHMREFSDVRRMLLILQEIGTHPNFSIEMEKITYEDYKLNTDNPFRKLEHIVGLKSKLTCINCSTEYEWRDAIWKDNVTGSIISIDDTCTNCTKNLLEIMKKEREDHLKELEDAYNRS